MTVTLTKNEWRAFLGSIAVTDGLTFEVSQLAAEITDRCRTAKDTDAVVIEGDCHGFELANCLARGTTTGKAEVARATGAYRAVEAWN